MGDVVCRLISQGIERASDCTCTQSEDVGVDHGGLDVGVAEELLNRADVGAGLEEVRGEGVAQGVGPGLFRDAGGGEGLLHGSLNEVGPEMMATHRAGLARVEAPARGRERPLPGPRALGAGVFDGQGVRHPDGAEALGHIAIVELAHVSEVLAQRRSEHAREDRAPVLVALATADHDLMAIEVDVFHAQSQRFEETASSVRML